MRTSTTQPNFINLAGWQIYNPPFILGQTQCYGYFVQGDRERLQDSVDAYLNQGLPDDLRYCVLTGQVLAAVVDIGHLSCVNPPQSQEGWLEEVDFAFFAVVVRMKRIGILWVPQKLLLLPLFLLVDNPLAVMGGREVFGYPKSQGNITLPSPDSASPLSISTFVLETFSPQTQLALKEVVNIQTSTTAVATLNDWTTPVGWLRALLQHLLRDIDSLLHPELIVAAKWAAQLMLSEVTFVFRKQFPDAINPLQACYAAIVEAPMKVTAFRGGGLIPGDHTLNVLKCDSLPIADFLGLPSSSCPVELAFHTDADFLVELGEIIHQFA
ncbi:MAG: hypothetical protein ACKV2Q_17845 [Planctomycetaceae bacterium]